MIPTLRKIKKLAKNIQIEKKEYFSLTEEFLILKKKFEQTFFELIPIIFEMIYPLYILYRLTQQDYSIFYFFGLVKGYNLWFEYFRYCELKEEIRSWILVVKKVGGPWISTNDSDYHLYVYADSMERILLSRLPKKLSKGS